MQVEDDRKGTERITHTYMVVALDDFMSGWGECKHGTSWAGWVCTEEDTEECQAWVESRSEMRHVRLVDSNYKPSGGSNDHFHIYIYKGQGRRTP